MYERCTRLVPVPRDHSDTAGLVDVAGHDADLAGAGGDDAWNSLVRLG